MPPGQRDERVGPVLHHLLAFPHGFGDDEFVGVDVGELAVHERLRDHPDGASASRPRAAGQRAHRRDVSSAGHQGPAAVGDGGADAAGQVEQFGVPSAPTRSRHRPPIRDGLLLLACALLFLLLTRAVIGRHNVNVDEYGPATTPTP